MVRRFKPAWTAERIPGGSVVKDATGQSLAYVYTREPRADPDTAKVLAIRRASSTVKTFATSTGRRDTRYVLATFVLESGQGR